ncbi:MAG: site-specific DNA-methyltransferase [Bacillota bacterium]|nr:site-specific DNA-methyltransferase [Bacillota bacterium]
MSSEKKNPETMDLRSLDISADNRAKLKQLFPTVFKEGKDENGKLFDSIDFEKLKAELGTISDVFEGRLERYGMDWPGKKECMKIIQQPSVGTLKPCRDESVNFDTTENLFIEGDNMEVLKLLQKSYYSKVKMIYIDPPYNTGKEFIYPDKYSETLETYLAYASLVDDEGKKFSTNTPNEGRFHTKWLNMMYPRLYLARNLLRDDGVIFISIDDNEVSNLRMLCDEIFGEENMVAQIVWKKKTGAGSGVQHVFDEHEYLVAYSKNKTNMPSWRILKEEEGNFKNPDNDERGPWESCAFTAPSKNKNPNQLYMIEVHLNIRDKIIADEDEDGRTSFCSFNYEKHFVVIRDVLITDDIDLTIYDDKKGIAKFIRRWAYAKQNIKQVFEQRRVYFNKGNIPRFKKFKSDYEGKALRSIYFEDFSTQQGTDALRALFVESYVEYPKPVGLIKHFVKGAMSTNDIILDFFAGSCTTAHAVLDLNKEDGGNRKFIMVQLPEPCDEKSEAYKAGYKTIADIGKERIRRVIKKIEEEQAAKNADPQMKLPGVDEEKPQIDLGFKVFKLDKSNFRVWDGTDLSMSLEKLEEQLSLHVDHIDPHVGQEDILYELLLKAGYMPTAKVERIEMAGTTVFYIAEGALLICLEDEITRELIDAVAEAEPMQFICLDRGFKGNDQLKANAVQTFAARNQGREKENQIVFRTV